ncbi:hypothetical protein [Halorubellus sp. PRR65]|uniref:hypothetical protein n=1 Tax=Halorubellus sp. PRR65 TaxID=3098148 RepID=UPI002B25E115|nr:hypothetical protein [Halorubellus sp. PRR65]
MSGNARTRDGTAFDPTHALVVRTTVDATTEARATAAAVDAVLDDADVVTVRVDLQALASDHPGVAGDLRAAFTPTADERDDRTGPGVRTLRAPVAAGREALSAVLALDSVHRFVAVERVDAFRDGRQVLAYVPDHGRFRIDADAAADPDALLGRVADALATEPAGVLPARPLATWIDAGTRYALEPPSLCVNDDACFDLGALERVALDPDDGVVRVAWTTGDGLAARALDALGPNRPARLRFDATSRYDRVATAFRTVADALDVPVDD